MIRQVFANRSNAGDWLSARGIRSLLGGGPVVEHLCDEPFVPDTLRALAHAGPGDLERIRWRLADLHGQADPTAYRKPAVRANVPVAAEHATLEEA